jgi:hypothetical protein
VPEQDSDICFLDSFSVQEFAVLFLSAQVSVDLEAPAGGRWIVHAF